jgi:hypothetical protein
VGGQGGVRYILTVMGLRDMVVEIFDLFCRGEMKHEISLKFSRRGRHRG